MGFPCIRLRAWSDFDSNARVSFPVIGNRAAIFSRGRSDALIPSPVLPPLIAPSEMRNITAVTCSSTGFDPVLEQVLFCPRKKQNQLQFINLIQSQ